MALLDEVSRFLAANVTIGNGALVAFSGGADSLSLLLSLSELGYSDKVVACYVNHRLRGETELSAELGLIRENTSRLGIKLVIEELGDGEVLNYSAENSCGTEAAARDLRYKRLEAVRRKLNLGYIFCAHNRDDNDETTLMRLMRGSLILSIPPVRGRICRPLLCVERKEIEAYLVSRGFRWCTDSTNLENNYLRNKVRNRLLPVISEIWPSYRKALDSLRLKTSLVEKDEYKDFKAIFDEWDKVSENELSLPGALSILDLLRSDNGGKTMLGDITVEKSKGKLLFAGVPSGSFSADLSENGGVYVLPDGKTLYWGEDALEFRQEPEAGFSAWLPAGRYILRNWQEGDRIGFANGNKRVCRMLQDMGIPQVTRKNVPVLVKDGKIAALLARAYGGRDRIAPEFRKPVFAVDGYNLYIIR